MPLLDISELMGDPDFFNDITIVRSTQSVDMNGRVTNTPGVYQSYGCVQPAPEYQLQQLPDEGRASSYISVVTPSRLFVNAEGMAADQVIWSDMTWRVVKVRDWSTWGNGFVEAICALEGFVEATT